MGSRLRNYFEEEYCQKQETKYIPRGLGRWENYEVDIVQEGVTGIMDNTHITDQSVGPMRYRR